MFLNFEDEEKELEHQYQVIAALEIIDYKINIFYLFKNVRACSSNFNVLCFTSIRKK